MNKFTLVASAAALLALSANVMAEEKEVQDMSDPLAVFTQGGFGVTNKGLNLKIGQTYDTGSATTMGMNIVEIKGFGGEALGWDSNSVRDNSIDSFRFRNFEVDLTNGRGAQIDASFDVERENLSASYSLMQALPKMGFIQFYPILGAGVSIQNDAIDRIEMIDGEATPVIDNGYSMDGVYTVAGMYSKITITDKIWLNYNPMFLSSISGSDFYQDHAFGKGNSDILLHEVAASYQFTPRFNVRYFANFSDEVNFADGDHRLEANYQF